MPQSDVPATTQAPDNVEPGLVSGPASDVRSEAPRRRRRFSTARRQRLLEAFPPRRCSARSSRTGAPCGNAAMVGSSGVCRTHGGMAAQVRQAADERVLLAEAMASAGPGRTANAILLDAMATLDFIARDVKYRAAEGGNPVPADLLGQLVEAQKTSATMAKIVKDLNVEQSQQAEIAAQAEQVSRLIDRAIGDLPPDVMRVIRCRLAGEMRRLAAEAAGKPAPMPRDCGPMPTPWAPQAEPAPVTLAITATISQAVVAASEPDDDDPGPDLSVVDERPAQQARQADVIEGELVEPPTRALPAADRCPACKRPRYAADHDQHCGWADVQFRRAP